MTITRKIEIARANSTRVWPLGVAASAGHGVTVMLRVLVSLPPRVETTRVTVKTPCDWYWWTGFWRVDVDDDPAPSPKFHDHVSVQNGAIVERSVNWKSVLFFLPVDGDTVKSATGGKHIGDGDGDGLGEGEGLGDGFVEGLGDGLVEGLGEGDGDGDGEADGEGEGAVTFGRTEICAAADAVRSNACPPVKTESIGEMRPNCAVTSTFTWLPSASAHGDGMQVTVTSFGETLTNDDPSSVRTAHMMRLVVDVTRRPGDERRRVICRLHRSGPCGGGDRDPRMEQPSEVGAPRGAAGSGRAR